MENNDQTPQTPKGADFKSKPRKVKYLAWDCKYSVMLEGFAIYADADHLGISDHDAGAFYDQADIENDSDHFYGGDDWVFIMGEFILLQFTGKEDKNGKHIYEGHILMDQYQDKNYGPDHADEPTVTVKIYYPVVFKDGCFGWIGEITGEFYNFHDNPIPEAEIVGNIYENLELLTKIKDK